MEADALTTFLDLNEIRLAPLLISKNPNWPSES
jgi:hypothetical protein